MTNICSLLTAQRAESLLSVASKSRDPIISSLPMKPEPSRSHSHHSKPVAPPSTGHSPGNPGAGKFAPNCSSSKQVKEEPNPNVTRRCMDAPQKSAHKDHCSSRTKDLALRICKICAEMKQKNEMIKVNETCFHSFCSTCVSKHIKTRITNNHSMSVPCPGLDCKHSVEFEYCLRIVPKDVLEAWDRALSESLMLDAHKFYCLFRDC